MTRRNILIIILIVTAFCFMSTPAFSLSEEEEAVFKIVSSHYKGANQGDVDSVTALFADDIVMMIPNNPATIGKENVAPHSKAAHEAVDFDFNYSIEEIIVSGDWAYARSKFIGLFAPKNMDIALLDQMKAVHILQKQKDGTWKIARFMFNSSVPKIRK